MPEFIDAAAFAVPGLIWQGPAPSTRHSQLFRYPWCKVTAALESAPLAADGFRTLRYVNPLISGAVTTLLDCFLVRLPTAAATQRRRVSSSAVCFGSSGAGHSIIGDAEVEWRKTDVFAIPYWLWVCIRLRAWTPCYSVGSMLFIVADDEVLRWFNLWREDS